MSRLESIYRRHPDPDGNLSVEATLQFPPDHRGMLRLIGRIEYRLSSVSLSDGQSISQMQFAVSLDRRYTRRCFGLDLFPFLRHLVIQTTVVRPTVMSYSVGIQLGSIPSDPTIAFEQFNALADALTIDDHPSSTFVAIHHDLTARFPCICDLPDDEVDDGVWSDGPLINNFGDQVAVIAFSYSTVETVLPFVIEVAHKHGATVFDGQTSTMYRPES